MTDLYWMRHLFLGLLLMATAYLIWLNFSKER
jgi:hypothetical protein